jgi:hypothetical protein
MLPDHRLNLSQETLHRLRRQAIRSRQDMGVGFERGRGQGVSEHGRNRRDRHAIGEQQRGRCVAHVVEAQITRQPRSGKFTLEFPNEVAGLPERQGGKIEAIMA